MKKLTPRLLPLLLGIVFLLSFAPQALASTAQPKVPSASVSGLRDASAHSVMPDTTWHTQHVSNFKIPLVTCNLAACEGQLPPPIGPTNCINQGTLNTKAVYDHLGTHVADLYFFWSHGGGVPSCYTVWAGFKNILTCGITCHLTLTNFQGFESGDTSGSPYDNSSVGAQGTMPFTVQQNSWYSTKMMDFWNQNGSGYNCYYFTDTMTDEYGQGGIVTNTTGNCPIP